MRFGLRFAAVIPNVRSVALFERSDLRFLSARGIMFWDGLCALVFLASRRFTGRFARRRRDRLAFWVAVMGES